jgi:DNA-binding transcriptional ArsR family regulator
MALKDLIQTTRDIKDILEELLRGRITLIPAGTEKIVQVNKESIKKLDNVTKILLYLAGKKAWELIEQEEKNEKIEYWVKPKKIEEELSLSGGSVRPLLRKLYKNRLVEINKRGEYRISFGGILTLEERIKKYEKK